MKNVLILLALVLASVMEGRNNVTIGAKAPTPALSTRTGDCIQGLQNINLDINNVRAMLLNSGDMWWDRNNAKYGVPKLTIEQLAAGKRQVAPLFAGAIWISGRVSGNLQMAAMKYSSQSKQFFPGPIALGQSSIKRQTCAKFDQFWSVTEEEIERHKAGIATSEAILNWPGKGNVNLVPAKFTAQEYTDGDLAPFFDKKNDGIYDPTEGDYPCIKSTSDPAAASVASQMIFWVINDIGNTHQTPDAAPIGIQMNCLAFAFATSDDLNNMTFYTYDIVNKSNTTLEGTIMSQWVDCDLGNYNDDYVGCDTTRSVGFCVNADPDDQAVTGVEGYGDKPPILAIDFFEGPRKPTGELIGLTSFVYFQLGAGANLSDPNTDIEHRNNQEGKVRNGQSYTVGGNCTGGTEPTLFCFPGNPNNSVPEWSMCSAALPGGDYRFVQNSGPFDMKAGGEEKISIGAIFVQPPANSYKGCKIDFERFLYPADDKAQRLFDFGFKNEKGPDAPSMKIFESNQRLDISLENLTSSNNFGENYNKGDIDIPTVPGKIADSTFKFEGYLIYQVKSPTVISKFEDLLNPANASLIKAMDLNNNVIQPKIYLEQSGVYIAIDSLPFTNSGITKQFTVTEDRFQSQGQKFLINNKPYYFAAIAVAYNNYLDTTANPDRRQKKQYKVSSRIPIYSATPHDENFYGIKPMTLMGQKIDVTRIRGKGHGNYFLEISQAEENKVIADPSSKLDVMTYLGGGAPINVLVNDPYKVRNADFKLTIKDSANLTKDLFPKLQSYWEMEITDRDDNNNVISITSESNIERESEQSIFTEIATKMRSYGVSVALSSTDSFDFAYRYEHLKSGTPNSKQTIYKPRGAEIKFKDSSKKWMSLLKDVPFADYTGWLRPGILDNINLPASNPNRSVRLNSNYNIVNGQKVFTDTFSRYTKILGGSIAPYCLASNQYITDVDPTNVYGAQAPGFKWRSLGSGINVVAASGEGPENNLNQLFSVNVVITNDKSKWSQCVVLETGDNFIYNEHGARKGQIRKSESLDQDFQPTLTSDTGRSYFPGYAINMETGERVNIYFGENSSKVGTNAANMIWDPTAIVLTDLGVPVLGNGHFVYVTNTLYDGGLAHQKILLDNFNKIMPGSTALNPILDTNVSKVYRDLIWAFVPIGDTAKFAQFYDNAGKYNIATECRIKVRMEKPYALYNDDGSATSEYQFSTVGLAAQTNVTAMLDSAFNNMRIVPNPYNAYSVYEQSSVQNTVKFIGVPKNSTITIVTTDGILIRKIKLGNASADNYLAANVSIGEVNVDDSYSWDMRTTTGILIASGVYYVHVSVPGKGEKVLKLFATMRSPDLSNF